MRSENAESADNLKILYEDDDVLVLNKPAGIMVHADGRTGEPTVVDWFLTHSPEARGVGEPGNAHDGTPLERSGVVHRLDRETSGVIILAKTQHAFMHLKRQFHERLAVKEYRAVVYGTMKEQWGTINRAIGRNSKNFRLRSAQRGARGTLRDAVTAWELIVQNKQFAYLRVLPKTGRMHQIRVHLKAINHPVVGDQLYAPDNLLSADNLGFSRLALHAHKLRIELPDGTSKEFEAPLPDSLVAAEAALAT